MRTWMMLAALGVLVTACADGDGEPGAIEGDAKTEEEVGRGGAGSGGADACAKAEGACGVDDGGDDFEDGGGLGDLVDLGDVDGDGCRSACAETASRGCDWVDAICDLAESVSIGAVTVPCMIAKVVACTAAATSPLICEALCPR